MKNTKDLSEQRAIDILGVKYIISDVLEHITIPDCFVLKNKICLGHGEAKLYIGARTKEDYYRSFFNNFDNIICFFLKTDLGRYLDDAKFEYENKEQGYRDDISKYWTENKESVLRIKDIEYFNLAESTAGGDRRFYLTNSNARIYQLFRRIMLPEITYVSILKLINIATKKTLYYFCPFLDYFHDRRNCLERIEATKLSQGKERNDNTDDIAKARRGQGEYRKKILEEFPAGCIITKVTDERILIASHIKPWIDSNAEEKVSKYNGLLLSPTYDKLFDQGFISFSNSGQISTSPYISPMNWQKLRLRNNQKCHLTENNERSKFLEYHRKNIFKGIL